MDVNKMIAELRAEREHIERAIIAVEHLALGTGKRRGRPPKWMSAGKTAEAIRVIEKSRTFSPEARKRMAEAQRKRWAAKRQAH